MARVLLCVPTYDGGIRPQTAESLFNLDRGSDEVDMMSVRGFGIAHARNQMAMAAIKGGYDYLFMVDSDVVVPRHALVALGSWNMDICLGWYPRGTDPAMTNVVKPNTLYYHACYSVGELSDIAGSWGIIGVKGGGLGCALLRVSALEAVGKPWFEFVEYQGGVSLGEDYFFCKKLTDAGMGVYVDMSVRCGHVSESVA